MEYVAFITFLIWMIVLVILTFFCNYLLKQIFRGIGYRYFVWLGVIVHEYSHVFACSITNTKIFEIKLFEFVTLGFFVIYFKPLGYIPGLTAYFGTTTPILDVIVYWPSFVISIGLGGLLLILAILVPIAVVMGK